MSRGIAAAMFLLSLIFSVTILSGLGFYALLGVSVSAESYNDDVQDAAGGLEGIQFDEDRSPSILRGPLASLIPAMDVLMVFTTVLSNTSGVVQLLFGAPVVVADMIETMFRISFLITVAFFMRGLLW